MPAMKKKKKKNLFTAILIVLIVLSIAAIGYVILFHPEEPVSGKVRPAKKKPVSESQSVSKTVKEKPASKPDIREKEKIKSAEVRPENPESKSHPEPVVKKADKEKKEKTEVAKMIPPRLPVRQVAIIIDDIGYDMSALRDLMKIDEQITYAVLPGLSHSRTAAEALHQSGREILMHLPMEPKSYPKEKPGAGALFTDMNNDEVVTQLEKNFNAVPYAVGVNNHMGSKFMSDEDKLTTVFGQLKKRDLFFVDSRTTTGSKAAAASHSTHLTVASRRIFLDNERDYSKIYGILMDVAEANTAGAPMIVIGHPYPETIRALRDAGRVFREKGVKIVPVSELIKKHSVRGAS